MGVLRVSENKNAAVTQVIDATLSHLKDKSGAYVKLRSTPIVNRSVWSYQFRLQVGTSKGPTQTFIVKVPLWDEAPTLEQALAEGPQASTRQECWILKRLDCIIDGADPTGLTALRQVDYLASINGILAEYLPCATLRRRMTREVLGYAWLAGAVPMPTVMERAGRWLRFFHERIGEPTQQAFTGSAMLSPIDDHARDLLDAGLLEELEVRSARLPRRVLWHTTLHGDMNLKNLLITPAGKVAGLDANVRDGVILEDVASVASGVILEAMGRFTSPLDYARRQRWIDCFLQGYGQEHLDGESLEVFLSHKLVGRFRALRRRLAGRGVQGAAKAFAPFYRRIVAAAMRGEYTRSLHAE